MPADVIYMFAMSLDGFIARSDGSVDWLDRFPANDDFDFAAFQASVTGIVMGRGSYEAARRHPDWHYGRWPVLVATRRPIADAPARVEAFAGDPSEQLARMRELGATGRIWMFGGGDLVRQYLEAGLLDTVEIGIIPVVLGDGIAAFGGAQPDRWLELEFAKPLKNGAIHARYRAQKA
ncbi:MAG: dihydrofolate reductase [Rhizobiaceae bacterium]|nr:dihydrofolate reductase [Rhizobiaceae bacterium]